VPLLRTKLSEKFKRRSAYGVVICDERQDDNSRFSRKSVGLMGEVKLDRIGRLRRPCGAGLFTRMRAGGCVNNVAEPYLPHDFHTQRMA